MSELHEKPIAQTAVSTPTHVLTLKERMRQSAVTMLLCTFEKQIMTDITTI